jgi:hypothetical protein
MPTPGGLCVSNADCCNGNCGANAAGWGLCLPVGLGGACVRDNDCQDHYCLNGHCSCKSPGQISDPTYVQCCSGYSAGNACGCTEKGLFCVTDADCCGGSCVASACTCVGKSAFCNGNADCCSGSCQDGGCQ